MPRVELPHEITYCTVSHVDVNVVAKSLVANAELINEAAALLSVIFNGVSIEVRDIRVAELSNGSPLRELLYVGLFLAYQEDLQRGVPRLLEKLLGVDVPDSYSALLTVGVMIMAIEIIHQAVKRLFPGKDIEKLRKSLKQKTAALAQLSGKSVEEIDRLVTAQAEKNFQAKLVNATLNFFSPAMQDQGVLISGGGGYEISDEAVREVPTDLDYQMLETRTTKEISNALVDIHRSDRDSTESGWRGIVKEVSDKKIRLQLSPEIDPQTLYGKTLIRADVVVVQEKQASGESLPTSIHIMSIRDPL